MAQKPLYKGKKTAAKAPAANRHGKVQKVQKGKLAKPARTGYKRQAAATELSISKAINKRIEQQTAAAATQNGLRLSIVRPGQLEQSK